MGQNFEGVFPRGSKLEYKSQQQATEPTLSREILSETHLPLKKTLFLLKILYFKWGFFRAQSETDIH